MSHEADEGRSDSELILYRTEDARTRIEVRLDGGSVWLTQAQLAELFETTPQNITGHLKAIYGDGEIDEAAICKHYLQVRDEGGRPVCRELRHHNSLVDAILAVGYRVRSARGVQFRQQQAKALSAVERDFDAATQQLKSIDAGKRKARKVAVKKTGDKE